jgi:MYXO-CTERM domain-containing protein
VRRILGILAGLAVAIVGGAIFGEQSFTDFALGALMGGLLGFFVGEATVAAAGERGTLVAAVSVVLAAGGAGLAIAISTERFHDRPDAIPAGGWAAVVVAAAVAGLTARRRRRTAGDSRPQP